MFRLLALSWLPQLVLTAPPPNELANCSVPPFNSYPYCDSTLDTDARIADLVARITPTEFASLLSNGENGISRLGVPKLTYGEALHGALTKCGEPYLNNTGCATSFPHPLALASALNRTLWRAIASVVSTESRALHNQGGLQASFVWAPNANLMRDPRWGRGMETPGEDPFVVSEYTSQFIASLQAGVEDSRYMKLPVAVKHAFGYDMENSDGMSRSWFSAAISDRDAVDYYYRPFKAAIQKGQAQGMMCRYAASSIAVLIDNSGKTRQCPTLPVQLQCGELYTIVCERLFP